MSSKTRNEVMAHLCEFIVEARRAGKNPIEAAQGAFPGIPAIVLYEAETTVDLNEVEAWWQSVEKTIDGEVIQRALAGEPE